ncbi:MAG: YihY/virulence factor BrkB family protein [Deltaproteobacteria bacterium]|nr:YihY/virulence factor BrkB family protein [Deltaproteobacteria bacterium]
MTILNRLIPHRLGEIARATVFPMDQAGSKRRFVLIYIVRLFFLVGRRLWRDKCPRQSAALAFQTLLSIVPLLAVAVAVASTLDLDIYRERMMDYLEAHLLPASASAVGRQVVELAGGVRPKTLGIAGGATLVFLAMTLLFNVERVVNEIFRCQRPRRFWTRGIIALFLLLGAPVAFGLSLYFTRDLLTLPHFLNAGLPLLFTILTLFLSYWLLPHTKISIRHATVAALSAGVFFEGFKVGFAFYAQHLGATLNYVYGTFAILPLFMVWMYMAWLIFLFGAELNAALHEVRRHDRFMNGE